MCRARKPIRLCAGSRRYVPAAGMVMPSQDRVAKPVIGVLSPSPFPGSFQVCNRGVVRGPAGTLVPPGPSIGNTPPHLSHQNHVEVPSLPVGTPRHRYTIRSFPYRKERRADAPRPPNDSGRAPATAPAAPRRLVVSNLTRLARKRPAARARRRPPGAASRGCAEPAGALRRKTAGRCAQGFGIDRRTLPGANCATAFPAARRTPSGGDKSLAGRGRGGVGGPVTDRRRIDASLVRRLLATQFPPGADLPIRVRTRAGIIGRLTSGP